MTRFEWVGNAFFFAWIDCVWGIYVCEICLIGFFANLWISDGGAQGGWGVSNMLRFMCMTEAMGLLYFA